MSPPSPAKPEWQPEPLHGMHADDLMSQKATGGRRGPEPAKRDAAADWLADLLRNGPLPVKGEGGIEQQATAAGLSMRTIRRAQAELGIRPRKRGFGGRWEWGLLAEGGHADPRRQPSGEECGRLRETQRESALCGQGIHEGGQDDDHLAAFDAAADELATFTPPPAGPQTPVWDDPEQFHPLVTSRGWGWPRVLDWLNLTASACDPYPPDTGFFDVLKDHRRMVADHLTAMPPD